MNAWRMRRAARLLAYLGCCGAEVFKEILRGKLSFSALTSLARQLNIEF